MSAPLPCIVLAGGLGTRLRSAVPDLPKCLAPVGARSFLELQLDLLSRYGVGHFVLSLGYMADAVLKTIAPMRARYRIESVVEDRALGTGGATLHAALSTGCEEVLVTNGDTWLDADLGAMLHPLALARGERMRLASVCVEDRTRYGGLEMDGHAVRGFLPKGAAGPGPINAGLYRVHRSAFDGYADGDAFSLESTLMPALVARRELTAAPLTGSFIDIGVPEDYRRFCLEHG
jgi:D-glycero-alpha-D-manno-heptose 1-phosphate guanylyltransferase